MKKLVTTITGGAPFSLDYLGFLDSKVNDIVRALTSLNPEGYIISGCVLTQGVTNWQLSQGYISVLSEVFFVPAQDTGLVNASDPQANLYWQAVQSPAAPSPHQYHDLSEQTDTFDRTAQLTTSAPGNIPLNQTPNFGALLAGSWNNVTTGSTPPLVGNWQTGGSTQLRFKKELVGRVTIDGRVQYTASWDGTNQVVFTLPESCWPSSPQAYSIVVAGGTVGNITISAAGVVTVIIPTAIGAELFVSFSGINFYVN